VTDYRLRGFSELKSFLDDLPGKVQRNIARGALRAAATPVMQAAKALAPVGPPSNEGKRLYGGYAGLLRDSIRLKPRRARDGKTILGLVAGGRVRGKGDAFYAHIVEFTGAAPHVITAQNRKSLSVGGLFFQSVKHPGMRARPFMRPALDSKAQEAIVAAGEYVKKRLATKEGLEVADIDVGIEQ